MFIVSVPTIPSADEPSPYSIPHDSPLKVVNVEEAAVLNVAWPDRSLAGNWFENTHKSEEPLIGVK